MPDRDDVVRTIDVMLAAGWTLATVRGSGGEDWHTIRIELRRPSRNGIARGAAIEQARRES